MQDQPPPATLVCQMNTVLLSLGCIHLEQTSFWPAFQVHFSSISILLYSLSFSKEQKFSRWTFASITHVNYNQLHLLHQERYLHSTSTWKALINFTFVLNGLYYIYPNSKRPNALWWKDLFPPRCRNISIAKEEKKFVLWHSKSWLHGIPAEQGKIHHSNDQR